MRRAIVTTSIHPPSAALRRFAELDGWELIVVGDQRTPHETYRDLRCRYLSPEDQERDHPELSAAIGWNTIQRRNLGFVVAFRAGAEMIATVDDDNLPADDWGVEVIVGREVDVECWSAASAVFDPLSVTNHPELWHRGFPVQMLSEKNRLTSLGVQRRRVLVQANLWNGDPDVDAIGRIAYRPSVELVVEGYFASVQVSPFNSQNTILHRDAFPSYCVLPFVGRMDDIWASYLFQHEHPKSVVYGPPTVFQERNPQDVARNLEDEMLGYRKTAEFVVNLDDPARFLPPETLRFLDVYRRAFD